MTASRCVTIIGGGLAGLSLGVGLRKAGVPTEIVEAGDYPRHRVCGEFITGLEDETIEKLGIQAAFSGCESHRKVTWHLREPVIGHQVLPSPARAISRFTLDARLAEMFVAIGGKLTLRTRINSAVVEPGVVRTSGRKPDGASPWIGLKLHARNFATAGELEFFLGDGAYVVFSHSKGHERALYPCLG